MKSCYSIGVDLGGTNLRIAAYIEGFGFLERIVLPTQLTAGRDQVVRDMCEAIEALSIRGYCGRHLTGIAVGSPEPLELPSGILRNPPNLPDGTASGLLGACVVGLQQSAPIFQSPSISDLFIRQ